MKARTKHVANVILIILLTALTAWYLSKTEIITFQTLFSVNIGNCIIVLSWVYLCFVFISLIEKSIYTEFCDYTVKTALLTTIYGSLGSAVSPLKSAHFPLKVYAQKTNGLTLAQTLTGITKCQIIFSTTSIIVYGSLFVFLLFSDYVIKIGEAYFSAYIVVGIGFVTNLSVLTALTLVSRVEKLRTAVLRTLASLIKIFKRNFDVAEFVKKKTERLRLFKEQTTAVFLDFKLFVIPALAYVLYMFMSCLAPYVSYLCVSGAVFTLKDCFTFYLLALSSTYLINVIPVPGGCVVAEFVFTLIFTPIVGAFLGETLLLWRLCSYYLPTVINLIVFSVSSARSSKRRA